MIQKIIELKQGVFYNTAWKDSPDFKKYNLIYGWNGTGKTTLAKNFRRLEKKQNNGFVVSWENGAVKPIRVFNKQFVEENIFKLDNNHRTISPLYVFGSEQVHIQKKINRLDNHWKKKLETGKDFHVNKNPDNAYDQFCVSTANSVKERLRGGENPNRFNNYDKRRFIEDISKLHDTHILSENEKEILLQSATLIKLDKLTELNFKITLTEEEISRVNLILQDTASARFIDELLESSEANEWVSSGLKLHADKEICLFCDNEISIQRRTRLNEHFNIAVNNLKKKIEEEKLGLLRKKDCLDLSLLPKAAEFYPDLRQKYDPNPLQDLITVYRDRISNLINLLNEKLHSLHEPLKNDTFIVAVDGTSIIDSINNLIKNHNAKTDNFPQAINEAREAYATAILSENNQKYNDFQSSITAHKTTLRKYEKIIDALKKRIQDLAESIRNHRTPAEEINTQLALYLGHHELELAVQENGYEIHRHKVDTEHESLCESEKTAIALIFFLNSLNCETFKLEDSVVVLDDPISSLDNRSLFTAFTFIKEHLKSAGQLFILTHNFDFMNQVKRWLISRYTNLKEKNGTSKPDKAALFMLLHRQDYINDKRYSVLDEMDTLIKDYQSEYHYYFKVIYLFSQKTNLSLAECMPIPNVLRKLIETFSSFQFPNRNNNSIEVFEKDALERGKLERYLNVLSHSDSISAIETMNDHYLQDTSSICQMVLNKIKMHNQNHSDEMIRLIERSNT